ncbi:MAG: Gfo/Idh/MocA family oxidoreductase, partial [Myxococcota bacterium]|nr:Gfo/Idh/MocA family oxidoreductase [Myxococcota bacterium]
MSTAIVIIGAGHLGNYHLTKVAAHPDATLHAIVELDGDKHVELETLYNVPICSELTQIPAGADAAIVATPTQSHLDVASAALAQDLHVLVEKPVCASTDEGKILC